MSKTFIKTASALAILASVGIPAVAVGVDVANAAEPNAASDFTYVVTNEGETIITKYVGTSKDVIIPTEINGVPVTKIETNAFYAKGITSVVIPDSVTEIGRDAFASNQLVNVVLSKNLKIIGQSSFERNKIETIEIPSSVETIGRNAFYWNNLTSLTIQNGVKEIPIQAFYKNQLVSISIPPSVKTIALQAFDENKLTSVTFSEGLELIDQNAFTNNDIVDVIIPSSVQKIADYAFQLNQIRSVTVKNPTMVFGFDVFRNQTYDNKNYLEKTYTVIKGEAGSTAEVFATKFKHSFETININDLPTPGEGIGNEDGNGSGVNDGTGNGGTGSETPTEGKTHHSDKATVKLQSGILNLDIASVLDFGTVRLEAQPKTVTTGFGDFFGVIDTRGTQEGWRVDVTATPFKIVEPAGGFKSGTSAHVLPVGSLSISPLVGIDRVGQSSGAMPKGTLSGKTILDDGAITVASAGVGEGMGQFKLEFGNDALSLIVDAATAKIDNVNYPGGITPYESTITWDLVTGP